MYRISECFFSNGKRTIDLKYVYKEWNSIEGEARGIKNTTIFYPANTDISHKNINEFVILPGLFVHIG